MHVFFHLMTLTSVVTETVQFTVSLYPSMKHMYAPEVVGDIDTFQVDLDSPSVPLTLE